MSDKEWIVLSSTSNGYQLYDPSEGVYSLSPTRKKVKFREERILIGDHVLLDDAGFIEKILPRKNTLQRPRLANADEIFVLVSCIQPAFSSYLLDKFLSLILSSHIKASIVLTKADLLKKREFNALKKRMEDYQKINFPVYFLNTHDETSLDFPKLKEDIKGKTIAFVGQTGVGKSSLLNSLYPDFTRKVDALYVNSGRGRHTTKEVILLPYPDGFLFDTPGFSDLELQEMTRLDLASCFPGYALYKDKCQFTDCLHLPQSKGCHVREEIGKQLSEDSYQNYIKISEEVKENERWKKKL